MLGVISFVAVVAGIGYIVYENFKKDDDKDNSSIKEEETTEKKEEEKSDENDEEEDEDEKPVESEDDEIGLERRQIEKKSDEEEIKNMTLDEDTNLVKTMYESIRFSTDRYDDYEAKKIVDLDQILGDATHIAKENVIHIGLENILGVDYLQYVMEIPECTRESEIGLYIKSINNAVKNLEDYVIPYVGDIRKRLKGWYIFEYEASNGDKMNMLSMIPKEHYEKFTTYNSFDGSVIHDGLVKYVLKVRELIKSGEVLSFEDETGKYKNIRVKSIMLGYELAFPLKTLEDTGVDLDTSLDILDFLINRGDGEENLVVNTRSYGRLEYKSAIFHDTFDQESIIVYEAPYGEKGGTKLTDVTY